jgi:hypothetical protein
MVENFFTLVWSLEISSALNDSDNGQFRSIWTILFNLEYLAKNFQIGGKTIISLIFFQTILMKIREKIGAFYYFSLKKLGKEHRTDDCVKLAIYIPT